MLEFTILKVCLSLTSYLIISGIAPKVNTFYIGECLSFFFCASIISPLCDGGYGYYLRKITNKHIVSPRRRIFARKISELCCASILLRSALLCLIPALLTLYFKLNVLKILLIYLMAITISLSRVLRVSYSIRLQLLGEMSFFVIITYLLLALKHYFKIDFLPIDFLAISLLCFTILFSMVLSLIYLKSSKHYHDFIMPYSSKILISDFLSNLQSYFWSLLIFIPGFSLASLRDSISVFSSYQGIVGYSSFGTYLQSIFVLSGKSGKLPAPFSPKYLKYIMLNLGFVTTFFCVSLSTLIVLKPHMFEFNPFLYSLLCLVPLIDSLSGPYLLIHTVQKNGILSKTVNAAMCCSSLFLTILLIVFNIFTEPSSLHNMFAMACILIISQLIKLKMILNDHNASLRPILAQ